MTCLPCVMARKSDYKKVAADLRLGPRPRKFFDTNGGVTCKTCFDLRNKNQELVAEITVHHRTTRLGGLKVFEIHRSIGRLFGE